MSRTVQLASRTSAEADPRWASIVSRDPRADGAFVYSVKSTGIYCRPSCAARRAKPENVQFHASAEEAERSGFRACKRCKPDQISPAQEQTKAIADLCRWIEDSESEPRLEDMASRLGMSTFHLHRVFKQVVGVTPKAYAVAHRAQKVRRQLHSSPTVTQAIYDSGYNSNSRFYESANDVLGMTPTEFRAGGPNAEIRYAVGESSLGLVLVAQTNRGVCAILMGDDAQQLRRDLESRFPRATLVAGDTDFLRTVEQIVAFIETPARGLDIPLDIRGTAFQQRVWQALRDIPAGRTASYTEIATMIGNPKSVRAVAQACAANALAVAVPCHRVVRSDGDLSGYRWGKERKRALLTREAKDRRT